MGISVACNRPKEIKTRLPSETIQYMSEIIKCKALSPCPGLFSVLRNQRASGPETAAISRSATVRFIIRYVLRLRSRRVLAKIMRVKA